MARVFVLLTIMALAVLPACRGTDSAIVASSASHAGEDEHDDHADHRDHAEPDDHADHREHAGEAADHDDGAAARFRVADFERYGVQLATAAAGTLDVGIDLPGEVRPNGDRLAHLAPRFPGLVRDVRKRAGDPVRAGEVLAIIESETLAPFELKAAFDGIVIDRHVAPGEAVSRETPAFIVADLSTVWVDVHVYQSALQGLRVGQPVRISAPAGAAEDAEAGKGEISYIAPIVDQATRTASARVVLPNRGGTWRPGLFVTVTILNPIDAALVVPRRAVHEVEGRPVVFVVVDDHFAARPVTIGRTGHTQVEITSGLTPGDRFADAGGFLVKAELGKGEGGHDH